MLTHGFDFLSGTRFCPDAHVFFSETPESGVSRNSEIERLFAERGGQRILNISEQPPPFRSVTWFEWRRWRMRLEESRKQEADKALKPLHRAVGH